MRKFLKVVGYLFLAIILLLIVIGIAIQTSYVQTYVASKVVHKLNEQFGTSLDIGKVDIDFWGDINLHDIKAQDHKNNDFLIIEHIVADVSLWDIYKNSSDIKINSLLIEKADVDVITYQGEEESNFIRFIDNFVVEDSSSTPSNFKLNGNIDIKNSALLIANRNLSADEQVWLDASEFNADIDNLNLEGNTYKAELKSFNLITKRHGEVYTLNELSGNFLMEDTGIHLTNLIFNTGSTLLSGKIDISYDSISDFSDLGDKVLWDINLNPENQIGFKDIRYFVSDWDKDHILNVQGEAKGTLNDLNLDNFLIENGNTKIQTSSVNLQELLNDSFGIYTDNLNATTSYDDLVRLLPTFMTEDLTDYINKFGKIVYNGALKLNDKDLNADGAFSTALGSGIIDLTMNGYSTDVPTYFGTVSTKGFNIGKLTEQKDLGKVAGQFKVDGRGFDIEHMNLNANGRLDYVEYNKEKIDNITVNGVLNNQKFDGFLEIKDEYADANYQGVFDFSSKELIADFQSQVHYLNLNKLGLTDQPNTYLKANIQGDATFSDIDDLEGDILLTDVIFNTDTINIQMDEVYFNIHEEADFQRRLELKADNYVQAEVYGKFHLNQIPDLLINGVGNFLIDFKPRKVTNDQRFTYDILINDDLISYFVPDLYIEPKTRLIGMVDNQQKQFELDLRSPYLRYDTYAADSIHVYASTSMDNTFAIDSRQIIIGENKINKFHFDGISREDTVYADTQFKYGDNDLLKADLNFYQTIDSLNRIKLGFSSSKLDVDNRTWQINPNNEENSNFAVIDLEQSNYKVKDLIVQSEDQFVRLNARYNNENDYAIDADLENLQLAKLLPPSLLGDFKVAGEINGEIDVVKTATSFKPLGDIKIDSIQVNNYFIGDFDLNADYNPEEQKFFVTGTLDRADINTLLISGDIDNSGATPKLDMVMDLDEFRMSVLGIVMDDVLSNWRGTLSGQVYLNGEVSDPNIEGLVTADGLGFKVVFLGTTYEFLGQNELLVNKQSGTSGYLSLPDLEFREVASNTKGLVDGLLIFDDLSTWFVDLDFMTDRLLVMNTTIADNELMYGKAYARGTFGMYGPATDLEVSAYGADILPGTNLSLNVGGTESAGSGDFIQFYATDTNGQIIEEEEEEGISGITIDMMFNVDEQSTVNLVIDEQADDKIVANGRAEGFIVQMNKAGNLNIEGQYNIVDGVYNFQESVIINKDFNLKEGGYIRFDGDPYNARLDIEAIYRRNVSNLGEYLGVGYAQTSDVELVIEVSGTLENMQIDFDMNLPKGNNQLESQLEAKLSSTPDERMVQVATVLLYGRFETSGSSFNNVASSATDAAAASAFELLGKTVGGLFSEVIPGLEFSPSYIQGSQYSGSDRINYGLNYEISPRLKVNGAIGTPLGTGGNEQVTREVEIEYELSNSGDGGLLLRAFSRPTTLGIENFSTSSTFAQSYGGGIVYKKSFDNFKDMFKGIFKKKKKKSKKDKDSLIEFYQEEPTVKDTIRAE